MSIKNIVNKIGLYTDACYPIMYINTFEELKAAEIIKQVSGGREIWIWQHGVGIISLETRETIIETRLMASAIASLNERDDLDGKTIILNDIHLDLKTSPTGIPLNAHTILGLKSLALKIFDGLDATVFLVAPVLEIPFELEKYITVFELDLLDYEDIKNIVLEFVRVNEIPPIEEDFLEKLSYALKGLTEFEIENLLALAYSADGYIKDDDLALIHDEKFQIIKKAGIIESIPLEQKFSDIGGLENLKTWLNRKSKILKDIKKAKEFGVDMPNGVLIVGMPGCGKSLTAKATAQLFNVPLLRLDIGKVLGKYVGDSENNLRRALTQAEAISPCVIWIDEVEKAFAGVGGSDSGSSEIVTRLFGFFLTWIQEKSGATFVVATANDITKFPPELLRKGRFDEIFFVDFPNLDERRKIVEIHVKKRRKDDFRYVDIEEIAIKTDGYSGADIEAAIKDTVEKAYLDDREKITTDDILLTLNDTVPSSITLKTKITKVKETLNDYKFKNASI